MRALGMLDTSFSNYIVENYHQQVVSYIKAFFILLCALSIQKMSADGAAMIILTTGHE